MAHHNNAILTLPGIDPESYYVSHRTWMASGVCMRAYYRFRVTLLGRFLCGSSAYCSITKRHPATRYGVRAPVTADGMAIASITGRISAVLDKYVFSDSLMALSIDRLPGQFFEYGALFLRASGPAACTAA